MTTSAVGAGAGWNWVVRAVNLGSSNPKAVFGGAALLLAVILALVIALGAATELLMPETPPGSAAGFAASLAITLPLLLVMACLTVGYLRLIHAVEHGRAASATDIFGGFGDMQVSLRAIAFMLLVVVAQNLLLFGLMHLLAPQMVDFYAQSLQFPPPDASASQLPAVPDGFGMMMALMWLVGFVFYAMQAIGIGQIALNGRTAFAALGDGASGALRNLPALLVLMLVCIAGAIALIVVVFLAVLLLGILGKLVGMWIAVVIGVPLYIALILAMLVVAFGVMYHMWRDICGDGGATALPADSVEL